MLWDLASLVVFLLSPLPSFISCSYKNHSGSHIDEVTNYHKISLKTHFEIIKDLITRKGPVLRLNAVNAGK